ncbi:MAG: hypothetical protein O7I93_08790 [Gemmatimonadetes bacterium]|nr:hypothetical protein [Gemmatimonadota bacterium]
MNVRSALFGVLVAGALVVPSTRAAAQQTRADSAGVLATLAAELAAEGRTRLADSLYTLILQRYGDTSFAELARAARRELRANQVATSGRGELIAWNTFYGAAMGVLIPAALGADGSAAYGAGLLIGPAVGYGATRLYTSRNSVTAGQARAITFGSWWGMWQGLGWREVLNIGTKQVCVNPDFAPRVCFESDPDEAPYAAMVIGGFAGVIGGYVLGRAVEISATTALIANFGAIWGTWYGFALGTMADGEGDALWASTLIAGNVGLVAAAATASSWNWTRRRAWFVHLAWIAGLVGGFGLDLIAQPDDDRVAAAIPAATSAAGLLLGVVTTKNMVNESEGIEFGQALLNWREDELVVGIPLPTPTVLLGRDGATLGLRLGLFQGRF